MRRFTLFAGKRLLFTVPQLLVVSVIVFFLIRLLPGDPSYMLAGPYASPERVQEVRRGLGLDQPIVTQYVRYLERLGEGDFGTSWRTSQPVLNDIRQRLPATLELVVGAVVF
jgi:peptide/nickel transport system permease protein